MTQRWIEFEGVRHDITEATQRGAIGDLRELLKVSGVSVAKIARTLYEMGEMDSILGVYESEDRLEAFAALLFLCLRKSGRRDFTWEDALATSMMDIRLVVEVDEEDEADPKAPAPSTPDGPEGSDPESSPT